MFLPLLFESNRFSGIFILIQPDELALLRSWCSLVRRDAATLVISQMCWPFPYRTTLPNCTNGFSDFPKRLYFWTL